MRRVEFLAVALAFAGLSASAPAVGQQYSIVSTGDTPIIDPSTLGGAVSIPGANGDDSYSYVSFGGPTFVFYGVPQSGVYVNSNGNLTFGSGDSDLSESISDFLVPEPRVGGFWDDLNPATAPSDGGVFANLLADRLVVTWKKVPEYSSTGSNTFQIALEFATGIITMNFDSLTAADSIVGIGPGTGYVYNGEVDFSAILGSGGATFGANEAVLEQFTSGDSFDLTSTTMVFSPDLDPDGDGVDIPYDNCPYTANPLQEDGDGDGVGDACDACPGFDDNVDADQDGVPDACDSCPYDPYNDLDGDGVCGDVDNCPVTWNPGQEDSNGDGVGDACPGSRNVVIIGGTTLNTSTPCSGTSSDANTMAYSLGGCLPIAGPLGELGDFAFSAMHPADVWLENLESYDTAVLNVASVAMACNANTLSPSQQADLVAFVQSGGKLIIFDSECTEGGGVDYSWLPFPFVTNNPGAMGASGTLNITEENVLSTSDPANSYFIDAAYLGSSTDAVGDMNVMMTHDPSWCLDMSGTNTNNVTGPVHTYARYGFGLIIYNGLDQDNQYNGEPNLRKMWVQELKVPFNPTPIADLPCGVAVVGIALTPVIAENEVGEDHTVTATLTDLVGSPQPGVLVTFAVVSGPNAGASGTCGPNTDCATDANGQVSFTYTGSGGVGIDEIEACFTDQAGEQICSQRVLKEWIVTNTPPVARCQDVTVMSDVNCLGAVAPTDMDAGSFDPDPNDPITLRMDPAGPYPLGSTAVMLIVTDTGGLSDSCTATVMVVDGPDTPPVITCPSDIVLTCGGSTDPNDTGMASATDNCDADIAVSYADVATLAECPADPVVKTIERTWTAIDAGGNTASCIQTITVLKLVGDLDIKPGSCPNSFNRGSHGVLPVGLLGTGAFDAAAVDLSSVRLSRADCVGGSVAPHEGPPGPHSVIADVGTPFEGELCDCHELEGDGIDDLSMKFKVDDLVPALQMEALSPGALVELVVTGTLDGCPFIASDCVRLVPPNSPPVNLRVTSTASGAWFEVDPLDLQLDGGGFAEPGFDRTFPETSVVTVTVASTFQGRGFIGWRVDGATEPVADTSLAVTMDGDHALEAVYSDPVPVLVASEPAADGTLPKTQNNVILLTFDMSISLPAGPALSIVPIAGGADVAGSFAYSVEPDGVTLKASENAAVLSDLTWYRITPAVEFGVAPFVHDVCTLRGDADGSGRVATTDYGQVKDHMSDRSGDRCDLDGSGRITTADYGVVNDHMGNRAPPKP